MEVKGFTFVRGGKKGAEGKEYTEMVLLRELNFMDLNAVFKVSEEADSFAKGLGLTYDGWQLKKN